MITIQVSFSNILRVFLTYKYQRVRACIIGFGFKVKRKNTNRAIANLCVYVYKENMETNIFLDFNYMGSTLKKLELPLDVKN